MKELSESDRNNREIQSLQEDIIFLIEKSVNDKKLVGSPTAQFNQKDALKKIIKKCQNLLTSSNDDEIDSYQEEEHTFNTNDPYSEASGELPMFDLELEEEKKAKKVEAHQLTTTPNIKDTAEPSSKTKQHPSSPKIFSKSQNSYFKISESPLSTSEDSLSSSPVDNSTLTLLNSYSLTSSSYSTTSSIPLSSRSESTSSSNVTQQFEEDELEQGSFGTSGGLDLFFKC